MNIKCMCGEAERWKVGKEGGRSEVGKREEGVRWAKGRSEVGEEGGVRWAKREE